MSLYGSVFHNAAVTEAMIDGMDLTPYVQLIAEDDISMADSQTIREFCASEEAKVLMEKQVLTKPSMMRLSKADDLKRRTKLVAYQLAKEKNDPLWTKMIKYRGLWRESRDAILKKYGAKAERIALASQKQYIKDSRKATPGDANGDGIPDDKQ